MNASRIELSLSPALYEWRTIKQNHTTVAVVVLRATTAICAAFNAGVEEIVPLDSLEPLQTYAAKGYLRAAERGGKKIDNAEYGNSPTEYMATDLHGKRLAYSTTNGTVSILRGAAVMMSMALWDSCQSDPYSFSLRGASHVHRLIGFGAEADIAFAFKQNTCPIVPQLTEGVLTCL